MARLCITEWKSSIFIIVNLSALFMKCAHCYELHLTRNKFLGSLFNASLDSSNLELKWIYSVESLSEKSLKGVINVDSYGNVVIKRIFNCRRLHNPVKFNIFSQRISYKDSSADFTITPISLFIHRKHCHSRTKINQSSRKFTINISLNNQVHNPCLNSQQQVSLLNFLPKAWKQCHISVHLADNSYFKVIPNSLILETVSKICTYERYLSTDFQLGLKCANEIHQTVEAQLILNYKSNATSTSYHYSHLKSKSRIARAIKFNNPPQFERDSYTANIMEEQNPGVIVTRITASDPDTDNDGLLTYTLESRGDTRSNSMFAINPITGTINTTQKLDREFIPIHNFAVQAVDHGHIPKTAVCLLSIRVDDKNDHAPHFEKSVYYKDLSESIGGGNPVMTVQATDIDTGDNANIRYSILNPSSPNDAFMINPNTGSISTRHKLDRETVSNYRLKVQAMDQGPIDTRLSSSATVLISIQDENDNRPQFTQDTYSVEVSEDLDTTDHPVIIKISATDADDGDNGRITYSITGMDPPGSFSIDAHSGNITPLESLDYETTSEYHIRVRAQDDGTPSLGNSTQVVIKVLDVNDNDPSFFVPSYQESVFENTAAGVSVVQVHALDRDSGKNREIAYSIRDIPPHFPFSINRNNGIISTNSLIDRENVTSYNFVVEAKDQGTPQRSATVSVGIAIKDINDNAPHFTRSSYEASISEIASIGERVVTVSAIDRDAGENAHISYRIASGNINNAFSISYVNGEGLITVFRELNYKEQSRYILSVSATDSGGMLDTAEVTISVLAANRFRPVFQNKPFHMTVFEDVDVGTSVYKVLALDNDVGENARVTYALDSTSFSIDPTTGIIRTRVPLDRETSPGYTLSVTASDHGIPSNTINDDIEVTVEDVNDNKPEFAETEYSAAVPEDVATVTSVLQISASDKDQYKNGQVFYTFAGGNDGNGDFSIDETSGTIRVNKLLDRETTANYNLLAYAYDRGEPPQSASVHIAIRVIDVNDNRPRFKSGLIRVSVPENSGRGAIVARISADDPDEGINAQLDYSLLTVGDFELFKLVGRPGEPAIIATEVDFDYEKPRKAYEIVVRASSPPFFSDASVIITIRDVNDNAPVLNDFVIIVNNYPNMFPFGPVGRIPAFDPDDMDKDKLRYKILSGNEANWLSLNETTGELTLDPRLNSNVQRNKTYLMSVTDGKNTKKATCQLIVHLVTTEMLRNSVTIRMSNMTQTAFMSPLFQFFVKGLASIINTEEKNIYVVNIQNDTDVQTQVLNVSLSVRKSVSAGGHDEFFPAEYIREQVYLQRAQLANISALQVLPFDDNLCLIEPCENFKVCNTELVFVDAGEFLSSDTMLFRPIATRNWLACTCPAGFTGMTNNFVCDVEVNMCYSSPCMNGGTCMRTEGGYNCLCKEDFAGKNCELNLTQKFDSLTCPKQLCTPPSYCLPLIKNGFRCEDCLQEDSNRFCQQTTRSFSKGSYLTYKSLKKRHRFHIQLMFATQERNGLLFYNGRFNGHHDFISLEVVDGQLQFSFSLGANVTRVTTHLKKGVNTGEWQKVTVDYLNRTVTLTVGEDCDAEISLRYGDQLGNYSCAVRVTHNLEERCGIPSNLCARLLDLSGPLQIGGLPSLPSSEQVTIKEFNGCIKDFYIDYELLDFSASLADKGTERGCSQKGNYCKSSPCKHGGTCYEGWGTYICTCPPRTGGKDCTLVIDLPFQLQGNGYVLFTENLENIHFPWYNGISFRTRSTAGTLMQIVTQSGGSIFIELVDGYLIYKFGDTIAEFDVRRVNDGKWHYFETRWFEKGQFVMVLDYGDWKKGAWMPADIPGRRLSRVYVGAKRVGSDPIQNGFSGCIEIMRVANNDLARLVRSRGRSFNVVSNCTGSNVCQGNPCGYPNTCVDEWDSYSCKCAKGRIGDTCQEICTHYNPCKHFAHCRHPTDGEESYQCECGKLQSGQYCENVAEQPCAASWWGFPVCGPCNCNEEKGFDAQCNKNTGQCQCQDKHYSPGDGVCYPCDCEYPRGAQNTSCHPVTGQCFCLKGAVGRRCDQCSSRSAEIEKDGCKIVYDSCPMNLAAGVWWERTVFGETRIQDCPYGALGDAKRYCDEDDLWGYPDLFNCTNTLFIELNDQLDQIASGKIVLNVFELQNLAILLRKATEKTSPMFGGDIHIAYRTIKKILLTELSQTGLDLSSERDINFTRNILTSLANVLQPKYSHEWNQLNNISGGASELLFIMEKYLYVLAESMSQYDGWPYQIVTDDIVLGVDSINKRNYSGVALPKYNNIVPVDIFDKGTSIVLPRSVIRSVPPDSSVDDDPIPKAYVGYILYKNIGNMLPKIHHSSIRVIGGRPVSVNSPVLSIVLFDDNTKIQGMLREPVKLIFKQTVKSNRTYPQCVYWKFTNEQSGLWSSESCTLKDRATMKEDMYAICECNHMTSFALLMDEASSEYKEERIVTFIALAYLLMPIALVLMIITVVILMIFKKIQSNANSIHINLIVVVCLSIFAYLIGIDKTSSTLLCRLIAIALHYFYMAAFSWMFVEVLHLYRMLTEIRDVNHGSMKFYYLVGYAIPGIIVSMAVGLYTDGYNNSSFCWLSMDDLFIWSFAGPITFVVVLNILTFAMAVKASCQEKVHVSDLSAIRVGLLSAILFQLLLGIVWIIGLLSVNEDILAFHYLFAIFSFLQGIFVFGAYIVFTKNVRFQIKKLWYRLRGRKLEVEENIGTRSSSRSALAYAHSSVEGVLNRINVGISTTSTTSKSSSGLYKSDDYLKSTTTSTSGPLPYVPKTSAPPYDYDPSAFEKGPDDPDTGEINHKRSNDSDSDSELSVGRGSLDLASSHSSDDDDDFDIGPRWDRQLPKNSVVEKARQQLQKEKEKLKSQHLHQDYHNAPPQQTYPATNPSNLWPGDTYLSSTDTSSHLHHNSLSQQQPDVTLSAQRDKGTREYILPPVPPDGSLNIEPNVRSPVPNIIPRGRHKVQVLTHNGSISSDTEHPNLFWDVPNLEQVAPKKHGSVSDEAFIQLCDKKLTEYKFIRPQ